MVFTRYLFALTLLGAASIEARAPDVLPSEVPEASLWCGDRSLGSPTRTTGECICKYACEGPKCVHSQGFRFFTWRDGMEGQAKCVLPAAVSDEERAALAEMRRQRVVEETARRTAARSPSEDVSTTQQPTSELEARSWADLVDDLGGFVNVAVAVIVSILFGSVLLALVVLNGYGVREAVSNNNNPPPTQTVPNGKGKSD